VGIINLRQIQEGMELGEDILNFSGVILLKAGSVITKKHLNAFRMWGITEANIKGVEDNHSEERILERIDAQGLERIESHLTRRFMKADLTDPIMEELYRLVKVKKIRELIHDRDRCVPNSKDDLRHQSDFNPSDRLCQSQ
jgi:hypothetical protein